MKYLQLGDSGRDVEVWQRFLARIWLVDLNDLLLGNFDAATDSATREFQRKFELDLTGIIDENTFRMANDLGLAADDALVPKGVTVGSATLYITIFLMLILLARCMLAPESPRNMQGTPLPITTVPNPLLNRPCPSWFC